MVLLIGGTQAAPVDLTRAKSIGTNYVQQTLGQKSAELQLVYTETNENGDDCLYVFNFDHGFVMVAADDAAQPILAYSEESRFDVDRLSDGERYFMRHFARQITYARENDLVADSEVAEAWALASKGQSPRATYTVGPLLTTNWDQGYPYNYYCPTAGGGPGGHVWAGCVATAMSMVMKFWNWPDHGSGSYSYKPENYPTQSANFEETYYQWQNMPNSISAGSQSTYIQAIATLMWHCGISVDMDYAINGSGAHSEDVPEAIATYFRYTDHATMYSRELYTKTEWEDMLIESLDEGFPLYYAGSDADGGHAFACDGYNDNRFFHFNWGWSGSYNNNYYAIDALNPPGYHFNDYQRAIFDFIPDYVYNALPTTPDSFVVFTENANSKTGIVSWTNPSLSVAGEPITSYDSVTVFRGGQKVFSSANPVPGQQMTFNDDVPEYDCYTYSIYYRKDGVKGRTLKYQYQYGPTCTWKLICQTTNFQGWNGGKLQLVNQFGTVFGEFTMTSTTPISMPISVPVGELKLKWVAPQTQVSSLTINLKNSSNTSVYNYTGNSNGLTPGVIFTGDNDCAGCLPPSNLTGTYQYEGDAFGALLSWDYENDPQSFKVYRSEDGEAYELVATVDKEERQYLDEVPVGAYYYMVTAYRSYCESLPAWTAGETSDYVFIEVTSVCDDEMKAEIFPNPANSVLTIQAEGIQEVVVYNLLGQVVYTHRGESNSLNVNTSSMVQGVYTVNVKTATGTISKRVAIMH